MRGRGKKNYGHCWNQWLRLRWFDTKNRPLWSFKGHKPIISGFDRQCVGGAKILERYRLLRIRFSLKSFFDRAFITR